MMTYKKLIALTVLCACTAASAQSGSAESASSALDGVVQKSSAWFNDITKSVKSMSEQALQDTEKYSAELKKQWPAIKDELQKTWKSGVEQGEKAKESVTDWMNRTFTKERVDQAEAWLKNFKAGAEEKVVDPLVPYLLSVRYSSPLQEWNAGYHRTVQVQLSGYDNPLELQLPLSWAVSQNLNGPQERLISWRSDSGEGALGLSVINTHAMSTPESLLAGLEKQRPQAKVTDIGNGIKRIFYAAENDQANPEYFYVVPMQNKALLLCAEVYRDGKMSNSEADHQLEQQSEFFDLAVQNLYIKPSN